jgi:hypothetical protein
MGRALEAVKLGATIREEGRLGFGVALSFSQRTVERAVSV